MAERTENLAQWMTQLPAVIKKQIPIINLAIPGKLADFMLSENKFN